MKRRPHQAKSAARGDSGYGIRCSRPGQWRADRNEVSHAMAAYHQSLSKYPLEESARLENILLEKSQYERLRICFW